MTTPGSSAPTEPPDGGFGDADQGTVAADPRTSPAPNPWPDPMPPASGWFIQRDPTPPLISRSRQRIRVRRPAVRRPSGRRATLAFGVLVPLLLMLVGTVLIAAGLNSGDSPEPPERPSPALEEGEQPVEETVPPSIAPASTPPTLPSPTEPPSTAPPDSTTTLPATTQPTDTTAVAPVPPPGVVDAAFTTAGTYLDAISAGEYETAAAMGDGSVTAATLAEHYAARKQAAAYFVDGALLGDTSASLRLLVVTAEDPGAGTVVIMRCALWNVEAGRVDELTDVVVERFNASAPPADVQARATTTCATMQL